MYIWYTYMICMSHAAPRPLGTSSSATRRFMAPRRAWPS